MNLLRQLWNDERGFITSTELILVGTIVVIGLIVGLATFRDSVVQELGDSSAAVGQVNQSFSVTVQPNGQNANNTTRITVAGDIVSLRRNFRNANGDLLVQADATFNNFEYVDEADIGDGPDVAGSEPAGIQINVLPDGEGT